PLCCVLLGTVLNLGCSFQIDRKGSSFAQFAVGPDESPTLFHDAVNTGQAEASSFFTFRTEKRFENVGQRLPSHTHTCIRYRNSRVLASLHRWMFTRKLMIHIHTSGGNGQLAALRHRIAGIYG